MAADGQVRLLVLVCSCREYVDRHVRSSDAAGCAAKRQACRETWLAELPPGVQYAFFMGGTQPQGEPDVWALDAPDTYHGLPVKVRAAMVRALSVPGWKWLFKCDDDTYCRLPRLVEVVRGLDAAEAALVSWRGNVTNTAHGGAGYLLPRALVEAVVADAEYNAAGVDHEDKQVTWAVERAGGVFMPDGRFSAGRDVVPVPGNELVTAHGLSVGQMRRAHGVWLAAEERMARWAALAPEVRPQSTRVLPLVMKRGGGAEVPAGLCVPPGVRRVVLLANVPGLDARAVVREGDFCVHINRARHFPALRGVAGLRHALVVRRGRSGGSGRWGWFEPPSLVGFERVVRLQDVPMRARRGWWKEYCRVNPGMCPTTGFICWRLTLEAAPEVQVVLAGFAPGRDCGTYRWPQHAWDYEAAVYAREGACVLPPKEFFLT